MRTINCVIIDDEPPASEILKCYIEKTPNFNMAGIYHDPIKALEELNQNMPDVLFCDVEMPDISGIQLLDSLHANTKPLIVVVSAHADYAIESFNLNAIDYLLKPVSFARYFKATQKILHYMDNDAKESVVIHKTKEEASHDYFFVKTDGKLLKISYDEILYIESLSDYIKIHTSTSNKAILFLDSLKHLEETLPNHVFMRIHRSYIVPVARIKTIECKKAVLNNGSILPISNSYYDVLLEQIARHILK